MAISYEIFPDSFHFSYFFFVFFQLMEIFISFDLLLDYKWIKL